MREFLETILDLHRKALPHIVVTLAEVRGEAPNDPGCKMIVTASGLHFGTVGGGKVEKRALEHALTWLQQKEDSPRAQIITWNLQRDIGMTCGGEVTYLFEKNVPRKWEIAIFGAGHVSQALVKVLLPLACTMTVVDARAEWVERLPRAAHLRSRVELNPAEVVKEFPPGTYFIVMTQGHATDVPILEARFKNFPAVGYVGAIGSAIKATRLKNDLWERGVPVERLETLRCPIGLDIGDNSPPEIAISIAAELLKERGRV